MKYVICDMDGTLLDSKKRLPSKLNKVIDELKKRDVIFGIASGRQYFNLYEQFPDHRDDMLFIAENGGIVYQGKTPVFADALPMEDIQRVIIKARQIKDSYPIACGMKSAYLETEDAQFLKNAHMYYAHLEIVDDILTAIQNDQIAKITLYDKRNAQTNSYAAIKADTGSLRPVVSGEDWVDISNPTTSKGNAIAMLKTKYHLDIDDFVAFGDFMNDYEMMKECTYSYAMANAHPDLKTVCNYETCSNDEDGVIKAICALYDLDYEAL
ncbi:HAD family hydrolase [Absiella sp. AM29-15]|uniref:HAD family hydrolase n=1 Tax=Absiella sp. AM29-15 TaxID=2292278 RepID=UPI0013146955|nr:HAD family hydrolase [Absiella sp. AM29-15]